MNLYKVYLGPKDGDLDYFGETIEAKDARKPLKRLISIVCSIGNAQLIWVE